MDNAQSDIGAILKAAREAMDISIANAAMHTNLSIGILEKLEANQFSQMTAPVFARGYLMQYSRFLGLDPEAMAADFNRLGFKDAEIRLNNANIASQNRSFKRYHFGTWLSILPLLALAGLVLVQVFTPNSWLIEQFKLAFNKERIQINPPENPTQNQNPPITVQIVDPNNDPIAVTEGNVSENPPSHSPESNALPPSNEGQNTVLELSSIQATDDNSSETGTQNNNTAQAVNQGAVLAQTATNTDENSVANQNTTSEAQDLIQLKINSENWVEVRNKEHRIVVSKVHKAGEVIEVPIAEGPYEFNIGRPEAVNLIIKGKESSLEPYRLGKSRRFKVNINE